MFNKTFSTLFMVCLAIGIVALFVFLVTELPLTDPFIGTFDAEFQAFKLSFLGG
jgi:hypothetical protein